MAKINNALLSAMESRFRRGETYRQIAESCGLAVGTVKTRLWRACVTTDVARHDANEKSKTRETRWAFNNGGCSTLSGPVPVTLPRLSCLAGEVAA